MPLLLIGLAVAAAIVSSGTGVFPLAVVNAIASFWSNGVMVNFSPSGSSSIPDSAATVSIVTTFLAVVFLIVGLVAK